MARSGDHAGQGKIGRIAETGTPMVVRGLRGDEPWLVNPGWSARQGVRAFVGYPLLEGGTVLGVLAVFEREVPSDSTLQALGFVAQAAALRLIDLRERAELHARLLAFEEALSPVEPARQALSGTWRADRRSSRAQSFANSSGRPSKTLSHRPTDECSGRMGPRRCLR